MECCCAKDTAWFEDALAVCCALVLFEGSQGCLLTSKYSIWFRDKMKCKADTDMCERIVRQLSVLSLVSCMLYIEEESTHCRVQLLDFRIYPTFGPKSLLCNSDHSICSICTNKNALVENILG